MTVEPEAVEEFITECREKSNDAARDIQLLEQEHSHESVNSLYRSLHTIKGNAQFFDYKQLGELTHVMESSLEPFRESGSELPPSLIDTLLRGVDLIDLILDHIQTDHEEVDLSIEIQAISLSLMEITSTAMGAGKTMYQEGVNDFTRSESEKKFFQADTDNEDIETTTTSDEPEAPKPAPSSTVEKPVSRPLPEEAPKSPADNPASIRVSVQLLDRLMNLVGEMVLVRNQVVQFSDEIKDVEFAKMGQRLDLVTSELQSEVMQTRMQPIGTILDKFQRVVRDLAKDLGKKITLEIQGAETELDRSLLEAIKDPLTHLVRNSCDHGVESPESREGAGKPVHGRITIRAFHTGGQVHIEIEDDGKGLDRDRISQKAVEKRLLTEEEADRATDKEIYNMIFAPGFSTAAQVSTVSGRGVGMDVVKTNIAQIGGSIELDSRAGMGSKVSLKIPLTLAIIPTMTVSCGGQRFAIPQVKLVELVRLEGGTDQQASRDAIENLQGKPVFRLRGDLLPLLHLDQVLGLADPNSEASPDGDTNVVILSAEGQVFGLVVDKIHDTMDVVVKPLQSVLKSLKVFSGAAILGDGSIALILDISGIAQISNLASGKRTTADDSHLQATDSGTEDYVLCRLATDGKYSVPLCLIHRLEELDAKSVERSGEQKVLRYRGAIIPLISLNRHLGFSDSNKDPEESVKILIVEKHSRTWAIEVSEILDIARGTSDIDTSIVDREGLLGNIVVEEEVVVVLDILQIIDAQALRLGHVKKDDSKESINQLSGLTILIAEDTVFFQKQIGGFLREQGVTVTLAENGQQALDILENNEDGHFDAVISDIEMPEMNGFELIKKIRDQSRFQDLPVLALTTRSRKKDVAKGLELGFSRYLEKFDKNTLGIHLAEELSKKRKA